MLKKPSLKIRKNRRKQVSVSVYFIDKYKVGNILCKTLMHQIAVDSGVSISKYNNWNKNIIYIMINYDNSIIKF